MGWSGYAVLSAVLGGLVAIVGKRAVRGIDTTVATTVRAAIMFVLRLGVAPARGGLGSVRSLDRRALLFIALSGVAEAGSWLCYFRALQLGDALRVAPIDRLSGAVALVLAVLLLRGASTPRAWLGTALMVVGAVIVARS